MDFTPLNELRAAYENPRRAVERYLKPALDFACAIAAHNPTNVIPDDVIGPINTAGREFIRDLCRPTVPPGINPVPEPETPFQGGQCETGYTVVIEYDNQNGTPKFRDTFRAIGPLRVEQNPPDSNGDVGVLMRGKNSSGNRAEILLTVYKRDAAPSEKPRAWSVISVSRDDGNADNCGSPPPGYAPKTNPPRLPPSMPIPDYPGSPTSPNLPVTIPPIILPPGLISPVLQVNVGPFNVNFSAGGFTIVPTIQIGPGGGVISAPGTPGSGGEAIDYKRILDFVGDGFYRLNDRFNLTDKALKELKECACQELTGLDTILEGNTPSGSITLPQKRNKFVAIKLTVIPVNAKMQEGGNGPDVYYQGWAWFGTSAGYTSERFPIDGRGKVYANTGNFDRFFWTCYNGTQCEVYVLNRPIQPST
jgi:hypothetical protein